MFTGIIEALGRVESLREHSREWRLRVSSEALDFSPVKIGDSIAVNGVCLTVTALENAGFSADVSGETMRLTSLGALRSGSRVNLEKALTLNTPLGGHLVSGHVDGLGQLLDSHPEGASLRMVFRAPDALARYIARKGSICIDGTSLTVNEVNGAEFSVNIIPHTRDETIMQDYRPGCRVNLEVDIISRYLERLVMGDGASQSREPSGGGLSAAVLRRHGYASPDVGSEEGGESR